MCVIDITCDSKCSAVSGKHFSPLNKQSARQFQALSLSVSLPSSSLAGSGALPPPLSYKKKSSTEEGEVAIPGR